MRQALEYWHPALLSDEVSRKPKAVTLCGHEIVVFRDANGILSALSDRCPHRKMRLSLGHVENDCIVCPYHGYRYDGQGHGTRPGSPDRKIQALSYQVAERNGVIWIKKKNSHHELPVPADSEFSLIGVKSYRIEAPFQLLLDNMTELEHTSTVHSIFGFDIDDMKSVETNVATGEDKMHIFYQGPYRKVPFFLKWVTGIGSSDLFIQTAEIHFEPVNTIYELIWRNPETSRNRDMKLRFLIFYNPITVRESRMFVFSYWNRHGPGLLAFNYLASWVLGKLIDRELRADIRLIESLPPDTENLRGNQLSRFDRPLLETRKYIEKIYYSGGVKPPCGSSRCGGERITQRA